LAHVKHTFCRICEPLCPLIAEIDEAGEIAALKPDRAHPVSKGFACHKGLGYLEVHNDPDRVNTPLRRTNARSMLPGAFAPVNWDDAFTDIGVRLRAIRDQHGPNAIAVYYGNPVSLNSNAFPLAAGLARQLGSHRCFNAGTQDVANKPAAVEAVFGATMLFPIPDYYHTHYLLCFGGNPKVSHWTQTSAHRPLHLLQDIVKRGGKVRFINPRRIESANGSTGDVVQIKPDTDVYLMAALLHEIDAMGRFDEALIAQRGSNIEGLRAFIARYPPERVAAITGVDAATIRTIAREYADAPAAATYMATGVNQGRQGTLAYWLLLMLSFVTGNLGRKGGDYYARGVYPNARRANSSGDQAVHASFGALREIGASLPGFALGELIEEARDPIRALIVLSGNPLLSMPNEARMRQAFPKLEFMLSVDLYRNATGEYADYVLPAADWLERSECNLSASGYQPTPYVQLADAVVAPKHERRDDWWIISRLQQELGLKNALDGDTPDPLARARKILARAGFTVEELKAMPSQTALLPQPERESFYDSVVFTDDKRVDCCPAAFAEAIERCAQIFAELEREDAGVLKLISLRTNYMHNGNLANMPSLKRAVHAINPIHMHPADASARALGEGDIARVSNKWGEVTTPVRLDATLRPGVVALSHGYGHGAAPALRRAHAAPGVNANALMPTGPDSYEKLSNMAHLNGVAVVVEKHTRLTTKHQGRREE
jgi:anaerobic selenocysteine-containing dehydrogenase